ncbi:MAG: hypothetical protein AAB660_02535 [Patescibacteria group bacterium]
MRITIIGNTSSGKSTLARKISEQLGIPYLQLDRLWFEAGGHKSEASGPDRERVRAYLMENVEKFIQQDSWVSDGWYQRLQPMIAERSDKIIFLDIPFWKRVMNHLRRMFFNERHEELSKWDDFKFIFEIIRRKFTHDSKIREFVKLNFNKTTTLRTYEEAEEFLARL